MKSSLAVLHNRNTMVSLFRASNWVIESKNAIVSRSVTMCAGMTVHTVIVAQTRGGFLTGRRRKNLFPVQSNKSVQARFQGFAECRKCPDRFPGSLWCVCCLCCVLGLWFALVLCCWLVVCFCVDWEISSFAGICRCFLFPRKLLTHDRHDERSNGPSKTNDLVR